MCVSFKRYKYEKMSFDQRALLAKINGCFGSLLFVSDNVEDYKDNQMKVFLDTIKKRILRFLMPNLRKRILLLLTAQ